TASSPYLVGYLAKNGNARYITAGRGALANAGRNTLKLPPIDNIDLSLLKRFNFTERYQFVFGAQMLNAFNHPQFVAGLLNDIASFGNTSDAARNGFLNPVSRYGVQESISRGIRRVAKRSNIIEQPGNKLRMVEGVQHLSPEHELIALGKVESLQQTQINVVDGRQLQRVATSVGQRAPSCSDVPGVSVFGQIADEVRTRRSAPAR